MSTAAEALEAMGLSISDAIRLLMLRVADERRMPFDVKAPNATTRKAIAELEAGKGKRFGSVDELIADLHADEEAFEAGRAAFRSIATGMSDHYIYGKSRPREPKCPYRVTAKRQAWQSGYDSEYAETMPDLLNRD